MKWKRIWISFWLLTFLAVFIVTLINRTPYFLLGGSSSVASLMEQLLTRYPDNHKKGDFNYVSSASAGAPPRVETNLFGIGWLSEEYHINPPDKPKVKPNLIDFQMMKDALIIVYNVPQQYLVTPGTILDFDSQKIQQIYLDNKPWNEVFPSLFKKYLPTKTFTRPNGSGTRTVFDQKALNSDSYYAANTVDSSSAMLNLDPGSIGYTSYADYSQAKAINVTAGTWENFEANYDTIETNIYSLWRPFTGIINKTYKYKDEIAKFLRWIFSDEPIVTEIFKKYGPRININDSVNQELNTWLTQFN
ncbi:MAG: substrate-binding domain-containing protein [Spiroplasma sp.]|nr:substrate-binding domain-containing protein [Spiroplasma sp.]